MSNTTESPFSLTIKIGPNNDLLTGRADSKEEMALRIEELRELAAAMQGTSTPRISTPPTVQEAVDVVKQVMGAEVFEGNGAIETKEDKFGNRYTRGNPDAGSCAHGARVVKNGTNKAGRAYKAYVCTNDSPFGNWRDDKCPIEWPSK